MSDRKYRQRGYQDSGDGGRQRSGPSGPRGPRQPGPRGRGLGRPTATVFRCAACGTKLEAEGIVEGSKCTRCGADLHTCTHCAHFDTGAPNECRQPIAERIAGKAARNRCELFEPRVTQEFAAEADSQTSAKSAFDALFKDL